MPRRPAPEEILTAAAEHVATVHREQLQPDEIGRPTARSASIRLAWAEDEELGLYFDCRRCDPGFGRYFIEVEREQPTERLVVRASDHFQRRHERPLPAELLWHARNRPDEPLATFMPMTPQLGASIHCHLCPQGMDRIFLTDPPYGDARRIRGRLHESRELRKQTRGFSSKEQADYVEAEDRGLLQLRNRHEGARALGRARVQAKEQDELAAALQRLLLAASPGGRGISRAITDLHRLALDDPIEFSVRVGEQLPGFAQLAGNVAREQFAAAVAERLGYAAGTYPTTNERALWELWEAVKPV